jgi:hypothetical protein
MLIIHGGRITEGKKRRKKVWKVSYSIVFAIVSWRENTREIMKDLFTGVLSGWKVKFRNCY